VIWANDAITDLGTLGGPASIGYVINDLGQVTGTSETASGAVGVFRYSGGTMTDLGTFGNSTTPRGDQQPFRCVRNYRRSKATDSACLSRLRDRSRCVSAPLFAPALLHKCSIPAPKSG